MFKRYLVLISRICVVLVGVILVIAFANVCAYAYLRPALPDVASLRDVQLQVPLRVYTRDGRLIAAIGDQRRIPVRYDQLPKKLIQAFLATEDGANLLTAYRRAANIVRIEEKKDGHSHGEEPDPILLRQAEETALAERLAEVERLSSAALDGEEFGVAMAALATLRRPVDAFFDRVTVNDTDSALRANRLRLLARIKATLDRVADFAQIEG